MASKCFFFSDFVTGRKAKDRFDVRRNWKQEPMQVNSRYKKPEDHKQESQTKKRELRLTYRFRPEPEMDVDARWVRQPT